MPTSMPGSSCMLPITSPITTTTLFLLQPFPPIQLHLQIPNKTITGTCLKPPTLSRLQILHSKDQQFPKYHINRYSTFSNFTIQICFHTEVPCPVTISRSLVLLLFLPASLTWPTKSPCECDQRCVFKREPTLCNVVFEDRDPAS